MIKRWAFTALLAALMSINLCSAQEQDASSIGANDDCTDISVDFRDDPNLTREEKATLMDQALRNSLNRSDRCQDARSHAGSGSGMVGASGASGSGMEGGQVDSTASAKMKGTNSPVVEESKADKRQGKRPSVVNKSELKQTKSGQAKSRQTKSRQTKGKHILANGKLPSDIPSSDNDSVLEEQIRQAAINEIDPVIKEKLWNEYRRYKGLPAVNKSQGQ